MKERKDINMNENKILKINSKTLEEIYYLLNKTSNELIDIGKQDNIIIMAEIALNPNTPTDVLKYLSNHEFDVIRGCVALNPNTPKEILEELINEFPYYVAENPNTPIDILINMVEKRITEKLNKEKNIEIEEILNKPFTIGDYSKEYKVMEIDTLGRIARGVARNLNAPKELLEKLANDPLNYIRRDVALNPNTPKHVLTYLVDDSDTIVSIYAIERTDIPDDFFEELAAKTPYAAVTYPNTPPYLLEKFADKYPYIVASNPNTPAHVLRALPNTFYDVVAENPNTPIDFLEELANKYPYGVASNPSTPPDLLEKLSNECPYQVASNPNAPKDLLEKWINHPDFNVRINIAKNLKASGELLKKLYELRKEHKLYNYIKEDEEQLLTELARNPNTPGEVLSKILKEILYLNKEEYEIENENEFLKKETIEIIILSKKLSTAVPQLVAVSNDIKEKELINTTIDPTTSTFKLKIYAENKSELVRIAVAMNTKTPRETLEKLKNDDSKLVRMAAIQTLNDLSIEKTHSANQQESSPKRRTKRKKQ